MASATLDYNGSQVTNFITTQRSKTDNCAENIRTFNDGILEMGEALLDVDGFDQAQDITAIIKELLDTEAEAKAFAKSLAALQNSYAPSERTTNFAQTLDQGAKRWLPMARDAPEMNQYFTEACSRLEVEEEEEEEEFGDDDIQIGGERGAAPNAACPLSGRPLMQIEDPVQDHKGYVYERSAIEHHIRTTKKPVMCPASATNHEITISELKKAFKVIKQQRHERIHGTQKQSQVDAIDVD